MGLVWTESGKKPGSLCQVELCFFETAVGDGGSNLRDPMSVNERSTHLSLLIKADRVG